MSTLKKILVFGTGRVTGPMYEDFSNEKGVQVTAVSKGGSGLKRVSELCPGAKLVRLDVMKETDSLKRLISEHDVVVSCVPDAVIENLSLACLAMKKNLVSVNYTVPEQTRLHQQVVDAGLTFLVDVGFRPGADHMIAKKTIDEMKSRGGEVTSYELYTSAIPTPDSANNPLKYKFNWNPRKALWKYWKASGYIKDGKTTILPAGTATMEAVHDIGAVRDFQAEFEAVPYSFHQSYIPLYGIEKVQNMVVGSMRYKGFCAGILSLMRLGLYNVSTHQMLVDESQPFTWRKYMCSELGLNDDVTDEVLEAKVKDRIGESGQVEVMRSLGLLGSAEIEKRETIFDTLVCHVDKRPDFKFGPTEQDMALMNVQVAGRFKDGTTETRRLYLTVLGDPGRHTAISKIVGRSAATAAMMVLNGEITEKGVVMPVSPEIYKPMLQRLERKGIKFVERK
ncbi:alpha-aminoadipic semialdehyde synthase, mitochondrial-like [Haliotis cracherodii]|uniref:alpha-aminoadipic semialdehyde synthase, mitochondrial-like n=1 Tax=Haliotis cracherodii TaxID=6455 RepID=UPI0039ED9614